MFENSSIVSNVSNKYCQYCKYGMNVVNNVSSVSSVQYCNYWLSKANKKKKKKKKKRVVFLIQILLIFGGHYNHYFWDIRLKICRLPNFYILFKLKLTKFSKSKLFSCLHKIDHVTNYYKSPIAKIISIDMGDNQNHIF